MDEFPHILFNDNLNRCIDVAVIQSVRHLKLLRAYRVLKDRILVGLTYDEFKTKLWKAFTTIVARRFNFWINALYNKFGRYGKGMEDHIQKCLPPLDVIMVWHSLLLNPKSCQDVFRYCDFECFLDVPLPLQKIDSVISNTTFLYEQPAVNIDVYYHFMLTNSDASFTELNYDCYAPFDPSAIKVPIYCPNCRYKLGMVDLMDTNNFGYADEQFKFVSWTNCNCGFERLVDHLELTKRLLYHDVHQFQQIPGIFKHFSSSINKHPISSGINEFDIDHDVKFVVMTNKDLLKTSSYLLFVEHILLKVPTRQRVIFREYLEMNSISNTISSGLILHIDLVDCVARHCVFIDKVDRMDWLNTLELRKSLELAFDRYLKFINMVPAVRSLIPTLDIDLLWHTHQLNHRAYHHFCNANCGKLVDHPDRIANFKFVPDFESFCSEWFKKHNQTYTLCLCDICSTSRDKSSLEYHLQYHQLVQDEHKFHITHVSDHNSCSIPSKPDVLVNFHSYKDVDTPLHVSLRGPVHSQLYYDY